MFFLAFALQKPIAGYVGFLKGKSTLIIYEIHANLKYKYGNKHFWCRGYYVDMVGRNEKTIEEYVKIKRRKK